MNKVVTGTGMPEGKGETETTGTEGPGTGVRTGGSGGREGGGTD